MNWLGSVFIIIINYAPSNGGGGFNGSILTESNDNLLTEDSNYLLVESA